MNIRKQPEEGGNSKLTHEQIVECFSGALKRGAFALHHVKMWRKDGETTRISIGNDLHHVVRITGNNIIIQNGKFLKIFVQDGEVAEMIGKAFRENKLRHITRDNVVSVFAASGIKHLLEDA